MTSIWSEEPRRGTVARARVASIADARAIERTPFLELLPRISRHALVGGSLGRTTWPEHWWLWFYHYWVLLHSDRLDQAEYKLTAKRPSGIDPAWVDQQLMIVRALSDARGDAAARWVDWTRTAKQEILDRFALQIGPVLARLGQYDAAFAALDTSFRPPWRPQIWGPAPFRVRPGAVTAALFSPASRDLRTDPRFAALCRRLGLVDFWQKSQRWPDCVVDVAAHYDFNEECVSSRDS